MSSSQLSSFKGGVSGRNPVKLTAYVVAALLEAGEEYSDPQITKAINCITQKDVKGSDKDFYEMALKAYALSLGGNKEAREIIDKLLKLAEKTKDFTYWKLAAYNRYGYIFRRYGRAPPIAIETAGYVVLAMMNFDSKKYMVDARPIVRWISSQRNSRGGFVSTQDTVVALQALALYETKQPSKTDLSIRASWKNVAKTFKITNSNSLLNQRRDVKPVPTTVKFKVKGTGCALLQVNKIQTI